MRTQKGAQEVKRFVAVLLTAFALASCQNDGTQPEGQDNPSFPDAPNVLVILTDDQRAQGTLEVMPVVRRIFGREGTTFEHAFASTPQCCPSRATIFSGRYTHNHGVRRNREPENLDQDLTMQRYLSDAGYHTALYGKFLNNWRIEDEPNHFDRFGFMQSHSQYSEINWNVDGKIDLVPDYSTDFVRDSAIEFLRSTEREDARPWFLYLTPRAAHAPYTPEERYLDAPTPAWELSPAIEEDDLSDKPWYVKRFARRSHYDNDEADAIRVAQLRTLMSVDDMVDELFQELDRLGEDDTLAVFMSDNGYHWNEHRLAGPRYGKRTPYEDSISVPLLVRWPGHVEAGAVDDRITGTVDIAPTILDAAGLSDQVERPMDGRSLLAASRRDGILIEHWEDLRSDISRWAALRTRRLTYVEYYSGDRIRFRELYDLRDDPWQLTNLLGAGDIPDDRADAVRRLSRSLARARACDGARCP